VLPNRQKLVGLKLASFVIDDSVKIGELLVKSRVSELKFMMVGTPENEIFVYEEEKQGADLVNDLDYDYSGSGAAGGDSEKEYILKIDPSVQEKLEFVIGNSEIALINPPRRGKKLLVLDLDYTLFDMKGAPESGNYMDLKRPYTDELLKAVYPFYDIVIWSQTSWRWLEIKLTELGILTNPNYKIAFVLDKTTMFTVEGARISKSTGKPKSHQVKPLELIWRKFPDYYSSKTTIHIDDLSRNFALNPSNGLKIRAFKDAELTRTNDFELLLLTRYLLLIAELEDFSELTHKYWKKYIQQHAL
jgi:ubiquitin-like domain-containing CTD phosphatase 1